MQAAHRAAAAALQTEADGAFLPPVAAGTTLTSSGSSSDRVPLPAVVALLAGLLLLLSGLLPRPSFAGVDRVAVDIAWYALVGLGLVAVLVGFAILLAA